jgi:ubiquinone/menaquinone biosynthesis C-methylase UbiE
MIHEVHEMQKREIIEKAKNSFNKDLLSDIYPKIHYDDEHLKLLLNEIQICKNNNYLDLGTGNGYIAFALAKLSPDINVYGLDIADKAIKNNRKKAEKEHLNNVEFDCYDGLKFTYKRNFFNAVITRYAIHHFPDIYKLFRSINSVLKTGGAFIISDPVPDGNDNEGVIDKYMQLKDDGHVRLYDEDELSDILRKCGFAKKRSFYTKIEFPRMLDERYKKMIEENKKVFKYYKSEIKDDQIYINLDVLNLVCEKCRNGKMFFNSH